MEYEYCRVFFRAAGFRFQILRMNTGPAGSGEVEVITFGKRNLEIGRFQIDV